jgi:hypothetical protein
VPELLLSFAENPIISEATIHMSIVGTDAAEYSPFANYDESLGDVFDVRRFQAGRRIAPWLVQNAGESQYDFPENSAVSFFRRGALRGLTFVAVATKEFAVRAAVGGA